MTSTVPDLGSAEPDFSLPAVQAHHIAQAAEQIARYGKHNGDWWNWSGNNWASFTAYEPGASCCTVGAIAVSLGIVNNDDVHSLVCGLSENEYRDQPHPVLAVLMEHLDCPRVEDLFDWSDNATEAQVVNRLREIANELRGRAA